MAKQLKLPQTLLLAPKQNLTCNISVFFFSVFFFSVFFAIVVPAVASANPDDWAKLGKQLPSSTSAVLAIDAEAMFQSDFEIWHNW